MSAKEILDELPKLSPDERKAVAELCAQLDAQPQPDAPRKRTLGLQPGAMEMAPDFDDPLPDEFWLGKDA